ncbi:hypothetical protein LMG7974_00847 [Campylobacter majalis]|uniref:Histidine kinase domain-containing protein n=1 Tax=Campylobacter majalis TaxID=2790656 RepID=A0ABM8Q5E4_9BACT|nr:cache domain-containing protein [Campylobacter majalis]CAD7288128.1 hypothetical protein LMG7974_00847 [Campylobacter majalis]
MIKANFKFYAIILLCTIFVVLLGINIFDSSKKQIIELSNKNKIVTSQNIVTVFNSWLDERINSLERISKFMQNSDILENEDKINKFIKEFYTNQKDFDLVQLLKNDGRIFVNGTELTAQDHGLSKEQILELIWFEETKTNNAPSINFINYHNVLQKPTINLCVPNHKDGKFIAAFCGVVSLDGIFDNIANLKLPPNSYTFIMAHNGEILTKMSDKELKNKIQTTFKELFLKSDDIESINLNSHFISIAPIALLDWFIGAGTDNQKEINELLQATLKNSLILLFAFFTLAFIANFLHNFMYKKIKNKQDEYEIILAHKTKMSEAGELISGINHQFIQPVNSIKLMITTLQMLQNEKNLTEKTLNQMLQNGHKSVTLLSDTIEIFRNFYKASENIQIFSVKKSIQNLLSLMHAELTKANIKVILQEFDDVIISQKQNIIQQILLILIHNAKDALIDKFDDMSKRQIIIKTSFDEQKCYIKIIENGSGVDIAMKDKIFSEPKTTKSYGNGFGLYFGKKLANEKINGNLALKNMANPTIFELSFDINLKEVND